jgi:hypothetical protein
VLQLLVAKHQQFLPLIKVRKSFCYRNTLALSTNKYIFLASTTTSKTKQRRLSNSFMNLFSTNSKSSSSSTLSPVKTTQTTNVSLTLNTTSNILSGQQKKKIRTTSQPAHPIASSSATNLLGSPIKTNKNSSSSSYHMELDSSSSAASTPSYALVNPDDEFTTTSGEEETSFLHETERKEKERKEREKERKEQEAQMKGTPPMTPNSALKAYAPYLSLYERTEILEYPNVYFVGPNAAKAPASPELTGCNFGFDDERGDYKIISKDHLCYRYEIVDTLGKGSFGQVLKCLDHKTGEYVAVKIIRNKKRFHCQALVEVKILECLNKWVYILKITNKLSIDC